MLIGIERPPSRKSHRAVANLPDSLASSHVLRLRSDRLDQAGQLTKSLNWSGSKRRSDQRIWQKGDDSMRRTLSKILLLCAGIVALAFSTPILSPATGFHLEREQIDSISEALEFVTDCAVDAAERLDDQLSSADIIARSIEPACRHYLDAAINLACRDQTEEYCQAVKEILHAERLYSEVVLQSRALKRRGPGL